VKTGVPLRRRYSLKLPDVLYLLVVVGAVVVRVYRLSQVPHTLWVDEAWFALKARDVVRGLDFVPIERPGLGVGDSPMQVYLAAALQLLGLLVPYSSRIVSAVVGSLTVALIYPALAMMWSTEHSRGYSRWMALAATVVLGGMFSHLYASRVGMQYALSVLATVLSLWSAWCALERLDVKWAVAAGLTLGASQYTYESCRILPVLVGLLALSRFAQASRGKPRRRVAALIGIVALSSFIAVVPLVATYLHDTAVYILHVKDCSSGVLSGSFVGVLGKVVQNYLAVLGGISLRGDILPGRNLVGRPMLDPVLSVFCWIGMFLCCRRFAESRLSQLVVLWFLVMLLPSGLSDQAPAANRMLAAAPAVASLVALGAGWTQEQVVGMATRKARASRGRAIARHATGALLALALILCQARNVHDYFVRWANDPRLFDGLSMGPRLAADRAAELAKTDRVYFTAASDPYNRLVNDLLLDGSSVKEVDGNICLPLVDHAAQTVDYIVVTVADHVSLAELHEVYPGGQEIDLVKHPDGYAYAVVFQVPPGEPGPTIESPVRVEFSDGPTLMGYAISTRELMPGESFELDLYWRGSQTHVEDAVSYVHVGKGQESDPMIANHDAPLCGGVYPAAQWSADEVLIDRHMLVIAPDAAEGIYDIAVGLYGITDQVRFDVVGSDVPELDDRVFITQIEVRP